MLLVASHRSTSTHLGILEEVVLAVDLGQFEGGAGAEALLLGQPVVLVLVVELLALGSLHHDWLLLDFWVLVLLAYSIGRLFLSENSSLACA